MNYELSLFISIAKLNSNAYSALIFNTLKLERVEALCLNFKLKKILLMLS